MPQRPKTRSIYPADINFLTFILLLVLWIPGTTQPNNSQPFDLLDNIPSELIAGDSAVQQTREQERLYLDSGDTLRAFTFYVRWMAYQVDHGNQLQFGRDLEPYVKFAMHHEKFGEHYLYQYLYGLHQSLKGNHKSSLEHLLLSENGIAAHHEEFLENLYYEVNNNFLRMTDFEGATEYALKNLELNEKKEDKKGILSARLMMATCFSRQNRFEEASRQRSRAAALANETGEYGQLILIFANNAIDERRQKNYDKSFRNYDAAFATIDTNTTFDSDTHRYFRAFLRSNKLTLFNDVGMMDSVILQGPEVIDSLEVYQLTQAILDAKIQIGRAYLLKGNTARAREHLEEAREEIQGTGFEDFDIKVNQYLARVYQQTGDYAAAAEALNRQIQIQSSLDSVNNEQLINSLQARYESDRQQQIIEETELQVQEEINQRKASVRVFTASLVGLALISFSFFQWRHRQQLKREKDIEISYNQKLIQFQEDENSRISKELHDGIGQSLMLIKNKVLLSHDEQPAQLVGDTLNEVRSISRALHPFTLQKLGLTAALEKLINDLDESTELLVDAELENVDERFSEKAALNIFRIVQEVLSNIMKHAQAKSVEVQLKKFPKHAEVTVRDNGVGFDVTDNFNTVSSLGLKTLRERTRFLGGQLNIHSEKGKGTDIILKIP